MQIKKLKKIEIIGTPFKVVWNDKDSGASFDWSTQTIIIGSKYMEKDPNYVFNLLMHEISELLHVMLNTRYVDQSAHDNYKFFMDHKEFENHNFLLSSIIPKFIV